MFIALSQSCECNCSMHVLRHAHALHSGSPPNVLHSTSNILISDNSNMLMSWSSCHFCQLGRRACMRTKTCCHGNNYFTETFTYATASLVPRPSHLSVANDKCWGEKTWERGFVKTEHELWFSGLFMLVQSKDIMVLYFNQYSCQ